MHKLFEQVEKGDNEGVGGKENNNEDDSTGAGEKGPVQGWGPVLPGRLGHCGRAECCHQGSSGGVGEEKQRLTTVNVQEISSKPEFLTSHNDQSLVEILVTR